LEALEAQPDDYVFTSYFWGRSALDFDGGDLGAARVAIRRARRGNPWQGRLQLLEARFLHEEDQREQARAAFAKAMTLAQQGGYGQALPVAAICAVDCDGDQPAAGLACLAQQCRADQPGFEGARKGACLLEEARCRFRANDLPGAERAARDASEFFEPRDYYEQRLRTRGIMMRVTAARGESARAIRALQADLAEVESRHHKRLAFETALALGDVEVKAGRSPGRARLLKLEQEAKSREFLRIARLAREALDQQPGRALRLTDP